MKISFIPTLVIAGSLMPFFQLQAVDYYLVNSDGSGKSSFATNTTGTGSGWGLSVGGSVVSYFPTAGNNYIVGNPNSNASGNFDFRTPADANDYTFAGDSLTINNSGGTATTRFLLVGTATRTITVNHLILNGGQVFCAASAAQTLAGNITLNGTTSFLGSQPLTVSAPISGAGTFVAASGSVTLTGSNSYTGGTIVNSGYLTVTGSYGLGSTAGSLAVNGASTTLSLSKTADTTVGSLNGTGGAIVGGDGTTVFTVNQTTSGTYAGVIRGGSTSFALGNLSTATLTLAGANTYIGTTAVNGGTLAVNGRIVNSGTVTVNNGGTLAGSGTISKLVVVNSGGHFAPGNSITTTFTTGSLTLAAGSFTDVELGSASATAASSLNDRTTVNGKLSLGGALNLVDNAGANSQGSAEAGRYLIFTGATSVTGNFSGVNNVTGYHANVDSTSTTGNVYVNNYQIAAASTLAPAVNLGITHVGQSFTSKNLSVQNTAASNGYAEGLNATKGATTGAATLGGSNVSNLAGGSTSTAITVGLNGTATVGAKTGTATVGFASNGTNSGYSDTNLASQTVTVEGQVNYYAAPTLTQGASGILTSADPTHYTLSLGSAKYDTGVHTATISLSNFLQDATYQDLLSGSFDVTGKGLFTLEGFDGTLTAIASGSSVTLTVSFDTTGLEKGDYMGMILFNPTSVNTSETSSLNTVSLGLEFTVVPEPATWAMVVGGYGDARLRPTPAPPEPYVKSIYLGLIPSQSIRGCGGFLHSVF